MIDLWQVPGLMGVAFEVVTQVRIALNSNHLAAAPRHKLSSYTRLQKLWMWRLPQLDQIGGSAKGLVCIVTGPTRWAPQQ